MVVRPSVRLSVCPYVHMSGCPFVRISMYDRVSVRDPHPDVEVSSEIGALAPIERLVYIYIYIYIYPTTFGNRATVPVSVTSEL